MSILHRWAMDSAMERIAKRRRFTNGSGEDIENTTGSTPDEAARDRVRLECPNLMQAGLVNSDWEHGNSKSDRFMVTTRGEQIGKPQFGDAAVTFLCGQQEDAEGIGLHWQYYAEFSKKMRLKSAIVLLGLPLPAKNDRLPEGCQVICRTARAEGSVCAAYCTSEGYCRSCHRGVGQHPNVDLDSCTCGGAVSKGQVSGTIEWFGVPKERISNTNVIEVFEKGTTLKAVAKRNPNYVCRNMRFAQWAATQFLPSRQSKPLVLWLYGGTGSGKTLLATSLADRDLTYVSWSARWFDGYSQQPVFVLDEVRATETSSKMLLRLLDHAPYSVEVKGGSMQFTSPVVVITSPVSIEGYWTALQEGNDRGSSDQLKRRVEHEVHMPATADNIEYVKALARGRLYDEMQKTNVQMQPPRVYDPSRDGRPIYPMFDAATRVAPSTPTTTSAFVEVASSSTEGPVYTLG